jgi:4-phytase/acid phosphatase
MEIHVKVLPMGKHLRTILVPGLLLLGLAANASAQLKYVIVVTRHGVRSPTWAADRLNQYSSQPWPDWKVPPGYLTAHGRALMKIFGAYDRAYLASSGLVGANGCGDASRTYFWADTDQRTIETGRALAEGFLPGCNVTVHSLPAGTKDPLFDGLNISTAHADRNLAAAAIQGRIGAKPEALLEDYRPAFEQLQQILGTKAPAQSLLSAPIAVVPGKAGGFADITGSLNTASTLAEDLLLEYTNGMSGSDLGWGRLTESNLRQVMALHTAYADLARRTAYGARIRGSNLLSHLLNSLQQATSGSPVAGAIGNPGDTVLFLVGHDANLSNFSGMLNLGWLLPGYQRDDTPPGGALVFELWRGAGGAYTVRTYYIAQSLEQMHQAAPLSLSSPPERAPVFLPGCSSAAGDFACDWTAFERTLTGAIDPAFVTK